MGTKPPDGPVQQPHANSNVPPTAVTDSPDGTDDAGDVDLDAAEGSDDGRDDASGSEASAAGVTTTHMAHDALFKDLFGDREHAVAALRAMLPAEITACIDFDALKRESSNLVTKDLRQRHGDLLYSAKLRQEQAPGPDAAEPGQAPEGGPVLISILLEHQSTVAHDMAWRAAEMAVYHVGQWRKRHQSRKVPPVVCVVVYNGTQAWTAPLDLVELMDLSPETRKAFGDRLLSFRYILDDLHKATDAEVAARALGPAMRLGLLAMKYARSEDLAERLVEHEADIRVLLDTEHGRETWFLLVRYIWIVNPHIDRDGIVRKLVPVVGQEIGESMLTYGQRLEKQGYDKGLEQGRLLVLEQLAMRFGDLPEPIAQRVKVAQSDELRLWARRFVTATTLDDVFAPTPD